MNRILITGGSGFLGGNLAIMASPFFEVFVTYFSSTLAETEQYTPVYLDIRNKNEVERRIHEISPETIIHAAAISNLDYCEGHKDLSSEVNVRGTENIALIANRIKSRLIHISTDLVFDGTIGSYSEEDLPNPLSHYGKTKFLADEIVSSLSHNYCIARTSLIFGWSRNTSKSFAEHIIKDLCSKKIYKGFVDEFRNPIYVVNLCKALLELIERKNLQGLYHICGSERLSRYDFALKLCDTFGFKKESILPVSVDDYPFLNKRPKDCSMKNEKAKDVLKTNIYSVAEGLKDMRNSGRELERVGN